MIKITKKQDTAWQYKITKKRTENDVQHLRMEKEV